ncbi:hypothetical protein R5R35_011627 [Gryllus longicercus]|uniref:Sodium-coupled monocarboxylate transporter 1 n=1 Tax=Gryllus longicercus TaxID=2509291 RepID=A0AAN9VXT4_9ORTH
MAAATMAAAAAAATEALAAAAVDECHPDGTFSWPDYLVLAVMLVASTTIGLVFGLRGPKQATAEDFLLGGSSMGVGPVALSLATSFITAIELLGNPAEVYAHGTQFWLICVPFVVVAPAAAYLYIPVFHKLHLTSAFEYLQLRFAPPARTLAAAMYALQMTLYTSVAVYSPALALSHVTGLHVYIAVTCVYIVVIVYASQGGMKAVMMTDMFQAVVLAASILAVLGIGLVLEGGISKVWDLSVQTDRLEFFNMDPNPTVRHSFWSVVVGGSFYWATMFCANQASIQKCLSVETMKQARTAIWASCICLIVVFSINFITGMIVYAGYHGCDPLKTNTISEADELLPLYVLEFLSHLPGIPGLFVAGVFAASLGTVAAALNSLTAVTIKDFITGAMGKTLPPERGAALGKWLSLGFGLLSFALVFLVERLGSVLQIALSFNGMVGGVTLGMFSLGMFFPWANTKGVMVGAITGVAVVTWICVGAQVAMVSGHIVEETKETSIDLCQCVLNITVPVDPTPGEGDTVMALYRLSYLWYGAVGCCLTVLVGLLVSAITGTQRPGDLDPTLISPPVWTLLHALPSGLRRKLNVPAKESKDGKENLANNFKLSSQDVYVIGLDNPALAKDEDTVATEEVTRSDDLQRGR